MKQRSPVIRKSSIAILAIWSAALISIAIGLFGPPAKSCISQYPPNFALVPIGLPLVLFGVAAFNAPHSLFYTPKLAMFIDARAGNGSYESFLVRLKPLLLFGVGGLIDGLHHVWWCHQSGIQASLQSKGWFFVSGGAAFILLHVVLRLRKAQAV